MKEKYSLLVSGPYMKAALWGAAAAALGLSLAMIFFPNTFELAATGLTAIALIFRMNQFLDENRDAIWIRRQSSWAANTHLTLEVISVFSAIFLVCLCTQLAFPETFLSAPLGPMFQNSARSVWRNNFQVMMAGFMLAFIYRAAGLLLVISWNALKWSTSIVSLAELSLPTGVTRTVLCVAAMMPHLVLEAAAYITAGMSGVFLSKALFKYQLRSERFLRVARAVSVILLVSLAILSLAMILEIQLAQRVISG